MLLTLPISICFFDGWWTLIIIIPCLIGLFTDREKTGNLIGICIGVFLLLCCQDIISFDILWKLLLPAIIIFIGIKLIFNGLFGNKSSEILKSMKERGAELKNGSATFSETNVSFDGEVFQGAELNAVFGSVKCDLCTAVIQQDCVINASAIFGGIDIIVPDNVNIKINSNSVFGGVSNKKHDKPKDNDYTLYINATCMFGGVDIK